MADKSTTVTDKQEVPSNPLAVEWPQDPAGITSMLRKEGTRAAGRVNGKKDKLALLIQTLDVLKDHAVARYKAQKQIEKQADKAAQSRAAREAERAEKFRLAQVARYQAELARLGAAQAQVEQAGGEGSPAAVVPSSDAATRSAPVGRNAEPMTPKEKQEAAEAAKLPAANPVTHNAQKGE